MKRPLRKKRGDAHDRGGGGKQNGSKPTEASLYDGLSDGYAVGDEVGRNLFLPGRKISDDNNLVAIERVNGVFNISRWPLRATPKDVTFTRGQPGVMYYAVDRGDDWELGSRDHTLNRPSHVNDVFSAPLVNESGTDGGNQVIVDLGEVLASDGKVCRPVKVVLDLDYWKGNPYNNPTLKVDATIYGIDDDTPEDILATQTILSTTWDSTSGDLPFKRRVSVPLPQGQHGTRFRIRFTYDNIALDTIQVYYDEQEDPR